MSEVMIRQIEKAMDKLDDAKYCDDCKWFEDKKEAKK